jgi:hypothetical protein
MLAASCYLPRRFQTERPVLSPAEVVYETYLEELREEGLIA